MIFRELDPILNELSTQARRDGAEMEVLLTRDARFSVSIQQGRLDKFDSGFHQCGGVRVVIGGQEGYCSTENLGREALFASYREALESARQASALSARDESLGLIREGARGVVETLAPGFGEHRSVADKVDFAKAMERATRARDARIVGVPFNGYMERSGAVRVFNSHGVDCAYERGRVHAYAYALARENQESRTAHESVFSLREADLDAERLGREAAEKALAKLGSVQPETGVWPVLLDLEPAAKLIGELASYLSGKVVAEKRSLYGEDLGRAIAHSALTIVDDPTLVDGLGSRPFDSEGTPTAPLALVENGVLKNFLLNSVYARKLRLKNTGHASRGTTTSLSIGPSNLIVRPGSESRDALLKRYPRMILVNHLAGFHAGFQEGSGNFSLQAEGELWENGTRVTPLGNFVVSGNFKDFLKSIEAVADTPPRPFDDVITPELLVTGLSIAGR
ncbi:MAG: TldD/PmbA family protein [Bdellovibrionaceae bacterium]|nr:TldD/PmbA family protein [Pseudobdellovibrionaceae bacterium]